MVEPIVWRFLEYEKRRQAVIIITILTGLVVVWPATDEYTAAKDRLRIAQAELEETQSEIKKLPQFTQLLEKRRIELRKLENQAVTDTAAQTLRSQLVQLVRKTGCTMRRIRLGDPTRRDWMEIDHPTLGAQLTDRGGETPFQLVSRQMSISITGSMANIQGFLAELHHLEKLIHTKQISLKRSDNQGTQAALDMDILLFNLVRKAST